MVGAQYYLPKGVSTDVLGYWYPEKRDGDVNNDTITIPRPPSTRSLAHTFLDFMLAEEHAFQNFADWVGYQPPQKSIKPDALIKDEVVPKHRSRTPSSAQDDFKTGHLLLELRPARSTSCWFDAWDEVTSGG